MLKKFVITGPESTGKSTLTKLLAEQYHSIWVKEYAREYLEKLNRPYQLEDILLMAKEQLQQEQRAESITLKYLFLDTDLTVFKVWLSEKYSQEVVWVEEEIKNSKNKIFFLCDIDIPWQPDPLREYPRLSDRTRLFNEYKKLLEKYRFTYHIISGDITSRLKKCKEIINNTI
ncbi:MAG: ATPase [Flavobacteriales bacterium CG_4_10_14_0_2_um_filter_32_8]|nr:MAG: ATPase [Flavobacteriales bacterium CG_4_10_14_0_2_um_filter_32_8]